MKIGVGGRLKARPKPKRQASIKAVPQNKTRNAAIFTLLRDGRSWRDIMDATGCSRTLLLAKIARDRRLKTDADVGDPAG
jgi:hypothetical protein